MLENADSTNSVIFPLAFFVELFFLVLVVKDAGCSY